MNYESPIETGHRYRDQHTGFEGVAVAIYFYEFSCPRVCLKKMGKEGTIIEAIFDAPGLTPTDSGNQNSVGFTG
jgi:hypothetical protein